MAKSVKREYSPEKDYQWDPKDEFVLSGIQFSNLYNSIKQQAYGITLPPITLAENFNILQSLFVQGVENGIIVEKTKNINEEVNSSDNSNLSGNIDG